MKDFGEKVKAAEKEVAGKAQTPQIRKKLPGKRGPKKGTHPSPATEWKPGVSANPGGRPKKTPITDAMREYLAKPYDGKVAKFKGLTNAEVLAITQFNLAVEGGDMRAAVEIADRVEGKVTQNMRVGGDGSGLPIEISSLTPDQKRQKLAELTAKAIGTRDS